MSEVFVPSRWSRPRRSAAVALAVAAIAVPIVTLSVVARQARDAATVERARADELGRRLAEAESRAARPPQGPASRGPSADEDRNPPPGPTIPIPLAPLDPERPNARPAPPSDVPRIRGVIRAVRPINGTSYATISVGTNHLVWKGMEFKVIDGGDFLGYLNVDSVEAEEAVGHLTGPSVDRVKRGSQVRTEW